MMLGFLMKTPEYLGPLMRLICVVYLCPSRSAMNAIWPSIETQSDSLVIQVGLHLFKFSPLKLLPTKSPRSRQIKRFSELPILLCYA